MSLRIYRWLLSLSIFANLALLAGLFWIGGSGGGRIGAPQHKVVPKAERAVVAGSSGVQASGSDSSPKKTEAEELLALLRERGVSRSFIGHVVTAMLNEKYIPRMIAIRESRSKHRWDSRGALMSEEQRREIASLRQQQKEEFEALMGEDLMAWLKTNYVSSDTMNTLTPEKRLAVDRINIDYDSLRRQAAGSKSSDVASKVESEWLADLSTVLTPEELQDYLTFNSTRAKELQSRLRGLDLPDSEYTDIYGSLEKFRKQYETTPQLANAGFGSFNYRLEESKVIQSTAGSSVALHVALSREKTFQPISAIYTSAGAQSEQVLGHYQEWLLFHAELERVQGSVTSQRDAIIRAKPIAERAYASLTAGLDAAGRAAFEKTATGAAIMKMRMATPSGG